MFTAASFTLGTISMNNSIGPCLPPHMQKDKCEEAEGTIGGVIGPVLPQRLKQGAGSDVQRSIGPSIPDHLRKKNDEDEKVVDSSSASVDISPALPPWMESRKAEEPSNEDDRDSFGPILPPGFGSKGNRVLGPTLPERMPVEEIVEEYEEDIIGPLPPKDNNGGLMTVADEIEKRAKKMKDRLTGNEEPKKLEREEWMLELPPLLQGFSTGPRKFRTREKNEIGDRSVWTDTPVDKAKRAARGKVEKELPDSERLGIEIRAKRDAEITSKLADYEEEKRKESLMTMHEKSRKRQLKEEKESGEENVRRPFDRELDLQTNRFDDAAKKRMIKKTQGLSSRFSGGTMTSKFL